MRERNAIITALRPTELLQSLHVIAAKFNDNTGLCVSVCTVRRYIRRVKMDRYIAVQKPFSSKKNIAARILWERTHAS